MYFEKDMIILRLCLNWHTNNLVDQKYCFVLDAQKLFCNILTFLL